MRTQKDRADSALKAFQPHERMERIEIFEMHASDLEENEKEAEYS